MPFTSLSLLESASVVAGFEGVDGSFASMETVQLRAAVLAIAELRRHVDHYAALAAGQIAHRSRRELGHQGLAQRSGFVSPVAMLQVEAQISKHEATRLVEMGTMLADVSASQLLIDAANRSLEDAPAGDDTSTSPTAAPTAVMASKWQMLLAAAATDGRMSLDKVDAIRRVMNDFTGGTVSGAHAGARTADGVTSGSPVTDAAITAAVAELITAAPHLSPEQLARAARHARDVLDADGIARREKQQHDLRSVRTWWDVNGMHCGSWRLAPEDGALVAEAFQQILSPRRGGPRFVRADEKKTAEELLNDPRTDEQITADAFTDMIRLAVDADPGTLFGNRRPAVRVIVTADRLQKLNGNGRPDAAGQGHGHLESTHEPVSATTIDRHLCDTGAISIGFDRDGNCVNVGRDQRLFTTRQRIGLAVRDGGCRFPGCERPPSYTEAHHINPWKTKHGNTDINDGVLLCRRHHMLIHNNHWDVQRFGADYYLHPPADVDPTRQLIPMPSRSPHAQEIRGDNRRDEARHRQHA